MEVDHRQRFTSFETSLVRLLLSVVDTPNYAAGTPEHRRLCILMARELAERRYGAPRDPADASTRPKPGQANANDFDLRHLWGWSISSGWTPGVTHDDTGVTIAGGIYGRDDGYPSIWRGSDWLYTASEPNVWVGRTDAATWNDDGGTGYPADTNNAREIGYGDYLPSAIRDAGGALRAEGKIGAAPTVDELAEFDPEHPEGDDRAYATIYEVPPILKDVLVRYEGMAENDALAEAEEIFAQVKDYLCVHSHNRRARAPSADGGDGGAQVSINDWRYDRIDNDGDGLVDEDDEGWSADADGNGLPDGPQILAERLGLVAWAEAPALWATPDGALQDQRRQYVAQLVANLIDFRDDDDVPTQVALAFTVGSPATKTAYGTEGLHLTEVMGTPDAYDQTANGGAEMVHDGISNAAGRLTDNKGWDWAAAGSYWWNTGNAGGPPITPVGAISPATPLHLVGGVVSDPATWPPRPPGRPAWLPWPPTGGSGGGGYIATFTFTGIPDGWYAVRVFAPTKTDAAHAMLFSTDGATWHSVDITRGAAAPYSGYVRDSGDGRLIAVQVTGQSLTFYLDADKDVTFQTLQLLPQYVEITNIAMHAPTRSTSHAIDLSGFVLNVKGTDLPLGSGVYYDAGAAARQSTPLIPAARGDGVFPVDYGYYVVAMSEAAYARQYGTNGNDVWGDAAGEEYPVYFVGDAGADRAAKDANADAFLIPRDALTLTLKDGGGTLLAGGDVDGTGGAGLTLSPYTSLEKTSVCTNRSACTWADHGAVTTALLSSQNRQVTVPAAPAHGQAGSTTIRTNLNSRYDALYDASPTLFKAMNVLAASRTVLPIVLNRPYASPAWLGLVPGDVAFRTLDPDPTPADGPSEPCELLGTLMANAIVGGDYARINLNTAPEPVLKAVFDDVTCQRIVAVRSARPWMSWDELLNEATFATYSLAAPVCVGYLETAAPVQEPTGPENSGAGSYADDFPNDSDEAEEWFRRFANLVDIRSTAFRIRARGSVPIAGSRSRRSRRSWTATGTGTATASPTAPASSSATSPNRPPDSARRDEMRRRSRGRRRILTSW